jgi:hypothetical protein
MDSRFPTCDVEIRPVRRCWDAFLGAKHSAIFRNIRTFNCDLSPDLLFLFFLRLVVVLAIKRDEGHDTNLGRPRDRPEGGALWASPVGRSRECRMKLRVVLELIGPDGTIGVHEVGGRAAVAKYAPEMMGLPLGEVKHMLAAVQAHLVRAQTADHCRPRRRCQRLCCMVWERRRLHRLPS